MASKLTKQLREQLGRTPDASLVEVILEIEEAPAAPVAANVPRAERIARQKQQFLDFVAPVEQRIQQIGGKVLELAWINHTLRARVPARHVDQLSEPDCVASVDMPSPLSRE